VDGALPFYYESSGVETFFRDNRAPAPRSRRVFAFHRPETLAEWAAEERTLRQRLFDMPLDHPLSTAGMRDCQIEAITKLEQSFAANRPRTLIQMATGCGKTYTACAFIYRLIRYAGAKRVLFLVDRANLGRQAKGEFDKYVIPELNRKFTELYGVQHLTSNRLDGVSRVTICTIQRLYSMLRGEELEEDLDELSGFEVASGASTRESLTMHWAGFWATTSNKQLNFVQHVHSILRMHGRAAVVVPDNVLFEGGAGETIRRRLLKEADVHTLLRLPTGIFYAQGVEANVLFFDRKPPHEDGAPNTRDLWIYDLRTNQRFLLKENPLKPEHLTDFVACYRPENRHERQATERFRRFSYDDLVKRDRANLDIFWLKDESLEESANLPAPEVIAAEIMEDLQAALEQFAAIAEDLKGGVPELASNW
jgi:hypothetical protein